MNKTQSSFPYGGPRRRAQVVQKNPLHAMVRRQLVKGVSNTLSKIKPAEKEDLVAVLYPLVLSGGNRDEASLKPLHAWLDKYALRKGAKEIEKAIIIQDLITLYRQALSLYYSAMEMMIPGFVDKQVAAGAERVDLINSQISPGGVDEGVIVSSLPTTKRP